MLTYQIRPRVFRIGKGKTISFPSDAEIRFHFRPLQPFGVEAGGGRTAVRGVAASTQFNRNTGAFTIESKVPLQPLDVTIREPERLVTWKGNVLQVSQRVDSHEILTQIIESLYFAIPILLNVDFADPPIVERVDGTVAGIAFGWELSAFAGNFRTTTQESQEEIAVLAWQRMDVLSTIPGRRSLFAALHYFHVACRLARQGITAGEFLAEAVLNYAKILEVLFKPAGDGNTIDAARSKLAELGFSKAEIEGDYIPAIALRNGIDVGHVHLDLLTPDELKLVHAYVDRAEDRFRVLLDRLFKRIADRSFELAPYERSSKSTDAAKIFKYLRQYAPRYEKRAPDLS